MSNGTEEPWGIPIDPRGLEGVKAEYQLHG